MSTGRRGTLRPIDQVISEEELPAVRFLVHEHCDQQQDRHDTERTDHHWRVLDDLVTEVELHRGGDVHGRGSVH